MGIGALTEFLKKSNKDFSQLSKASKKEIALLQLDIQGHENQTAHEISKLIMTLLRLRKKLDLVNKNKIRKVGIRDDKSSCYVDGKYCSSEIKRCEICYYPVCTSCSKIEERIVPPYKVRVCNSCKSRKRKRDEEKEKEILAKT